MFGCKNVDNYWQGKEKIYIFVKILKTNTLCKDCRLLFCAC